MAICTASFIRGDKWRVAWNIKNAFDNEHAYVTMKWRGNSLYIDTDVYTYDLHWILTINAIPDIPSNKGIALMKANFNITLEKTLFICIRMKLHVPVHLHASFIIPLHRE